MSTSQTNYNTDIQVNIKGDSSDLKKAADESVKEAEKVSSKFSEMGKMGGEGFNMLKEGMIGAGEKLAEFGMDGIKELAGVGKEVISLAGDYEANMNRLKFITNATDSDMQAFNATAIQTGKDTYFSSKEAAAGMADLAQMGYKLTDIQTLMGPAANAAMLNNIGLSDATTVLTETIHAYGLSVDDSTHTLDLMTKASQLGRLSFEDFGKQAQSVGGLARASGQSLAEMTTQELALTNTGMTAARASDTLRFTLTSMEKPTKNAAGVMQDLGLTYFDSQGKMKPMTQIFQELQSKMSGMTKEQETFTVATLFGKNGILSYNAAVGAQATVMENGIAVHKTGIAAEIAMRGELENSNGTVTKATDILKTGFNYAWKNLTGSIEEAQIAIGQKLLPVLTVLVTGVKDIVNAFIDWETKTHTVSTAIVDLIKSLEISLKPAFEFLLKTSMQIALIFWEKILPAFGAFISFLMKNVVPPLVDFATIVLKDVIKNLTAMVTFFIDKVIPVIKVFAEYFVTNVLPILKTMIDFIAESIVPKLISFAGFIIDKVLPVLAQIGDWIIKNVLPPLGQLIDWIVNKVIPAMAQGGESIFSHIMPAIQGIGKWIGEIFPSVRDFVLVIGEKLINIAKSLWDNFNIYIMPALKNFGKFVMDTIIPNIKSFIDWFAKNLFPVLLQFWDIIANNVIPILAVWISFLIDKVLPVIWNVVQIIAGFLKPIFEAVAWVVSTIILPAFNQLARWFIEFGIPIFNRFVEILTQYVIPTAKFLGEILGNFLGGVVIIVGAVFTHLSEIFNIIIVPAFNAVMWVLKPLIDMFSLFANVIGFVLGGAFQGVMWIFTSGIPAAFNFIGTLIGNIVGTIKGMLQGIANFFIDVINTPINLINNLINMLKGIDLPVVGKVFQWLPNIPTLGYVSLLAEGTNNFKGGAAIVGEKDPEVVTIGDKSYVVKTPTLIPYLPPGSRVTQLDDQTVGKPKGPQGQPEIHHHTTQYNVTGTFQAVEPDSLMDTLKYLQMSHSKV